MNRLLRWEKKGRIFNVEGNHDWMLHHASQPIADKVDDEVLRIYFGPRDKHQRTTTTFIEVEANNPSNVLYVHDRPLMPLGDLGTFDDSGVMPSCLVTHEGRKYLYYNGWNRGVTVPYRNSIGLAVSEDNGLTFERVFAGPVVDRSKEEPYFCATPYVMIDDGVWKMWYASSTGWTLIDDHPEPLYQIKYAESDDGANWNRDNVTCIEYESEGEANARPSVTKDNGVYRMWYCYRGSLRYRTDREQSYRIGYAESDDGVRWTRKDRQVGIERSEKGWDSEMMGYPNVYEHKGSKYMLYNGNGFGESGFGYAVLEES